MRYRVLVVGWALVWSGLLLFGYVGWQLFVTDLLNASQQAEATGALRTEFSRPAPEPEVIEPDDEEPPGEEEPEPMEYFPEERVETGEAFAFLTIPSIGLEGVVVYEGVDRETLKKGPGHMGRTPVPGQPGNAVISGHRTTYGRPFFDFDLLEVGDTVEMETATGTHVYEVREIEVVEPTDVWVTDPRDGAWLTMTTCEPKFSARQRLVIWAEMVAGPNFDYVQSQGLEAVSP
ncbi:MAG TPA: class E sortase [Acidimicrobiia bacterium]|nr:class E sortase [Acidimicrobiia bacterium]